MDLQDFYDLYLAKYRIKENIQPALLEGQIVDESISYC